MVAQRDLHHMGNAGPAPQPTSAVVGGTALARGWLARPLDKARVQSGIWAAGFALSACFVYALIATGHDYILFPALAGFMIVAPLLAIGLYEKSRAIEEGRPVSLRAMVFVRPRAGAQVFFLGFLLCMLMLLWMRAAVLLYALFFGVTAFPGLDHIVPMLFGTPYGWLMLAVGSAVGGLFAAFAFAVSMFSVPMLLDRPVDALTAMASSMRLVWNNLAPLLAWGFIVCLFFAVCVATGLIGLILLFPWLGHATWHAYRSVALSAEDSA